MALEPSYLDFLAHSSYLISDAETVVEVVVDHQA